MSEIEKGIPMPSGRPMQSRYPWREMEVGDSFVATVKGKGRPAPPKELVAQGWKFAMRMTEDGLRVWRTQ